MNLTPLARELTLSAIDLTRACAAHELLWCAQHAQTSAAIAQYLAAATIELEEQLHSGPSLSADPSVASETLGFPNGVRIPLSNRANKRGSAGYRRRGERTNLAVPIRSHGRYGAVLRLPGANRRS